MLTRTAAQTAVSEEGWSVQGGYGFVNYAEGKKTLRVSLELGSTAGNNTSCLLDSSTWQWEEPASSPKTSFLGRLFSGAKAAQPSPSTQIEPPVLMEKRRQIVQRLKAALEFLGYPTETYTLEVSAGLQEPPWERWGKEGEPTVELLDDNKLRYARHGKSLTVPVLLSSSPVAEVQLQHFQHWDSPCEKELLVMSEQWWVIQNFSWLLGNRGCALQVRK